ncbi:MAG: DUF736 domain-containing protein [Aestuariivirga sp.]
MSVIGTFVATTDGYVGTIRTLTLHAKLRLVAVDTKTKGDSPDFRFLFGLQEVGAAWKAVTHEAEPREYLSGCVVRGEWEVELCLAAKELKQTLAVELF